MTMFQKLVLMLLSRLVANTAARLCTNKQRENAELLFAENYKVVVKCILVEESKGEREPEAPSVEESRVIIPGR